MGEKNTAGATLDPASAGFESLEQIGQGDENIPVEFTISGGGAAPVPVPPVPIPPQGQPPAYPPQKPLAPPSTPEQPPYPPQDAEKPCRR